MSRQKNQRVSTDDTSTTTAAVDDNLINITCDASAFESKHDNKGQSQQRRSLFIRSIPVTATSESLTKHFSQSYLLKHATVVTDPTTNLSKGYGFVTFADAEDAYKAKTEFNGSLLEGRRLKVEIAEPRSRGLGGNHARSIRDSKATTFAASASATPYPENSTILKSPKLIIRNLPWTIQEPDQLAAIFRSYGKVKFATLPKNKAGQLSGFGFVVLRGIKNAEKALEGVNGKEIEGRSLAVDWAVEKDVWESSINQGRTSKVNGQDAEGAMTSGDADSVKSEDHEGDSQVNAIPNSSELEESSNSGKREDYADTQVGKVPRHHRLDDTLSTLFIRNLPFSATDDILLQQFVSFGPVRYARVVLDQVTDKPKGTGFVCFHRVDDAKACLQASPRLQAASFGGRKLGLAAPSAKASILEDIYADPSGRFTLHGRVLQLSRAVGRDEASRLTAEGSSYRRLRDKDKRRLYLLSEGIVPSNSHLFHNLSSAEVKMREDSVKQRQTLIKSNPALHLSLTRLSVRNIPRSINSKELKALAREAVVGFAKDVKSGNRRGLSKEELYRGGEEMKQADKFRKARGKGIVKQAKIVFEGREGAKVAEESGAGRSRGYGFIEYVSHRWALMGLRWLNGRAVEPKIKDAANNISDVKERKKRLIVEFAIENAQVVGRRQDREARAKETTQINPNQKGEAGRSEKLMSSSNSLAAKAMKGIKRKRGSEEGIAAETKQPVHSNEIARHQRIVAKRRTL